MKVFLLTLVAFGTLWSSGQADSCDRKKLTVGQQGSSDIVVISAFFKNGKRIMFLLQDESIQYYVCLWCK